MIADTVQDVAIEARAQFETGRYKVRRLKKTYSRHNAHKLRIEHWYEKQMENQPVAEKYINKCIENWLWWAWSFDNNNVQMQTLLRNTLAEILIPAQRQMQLKGVSRDDVNQYIRLFLK